MTNKREVIERIEAMIEETKLRGRLQDIVEEGDLRKLTKLANQGEDILFGDNVLLLIAVGRGHLDIVKYLVKNGADINCRGGEPEYISLACQNKEVYRYLVKQGSDGKGKERFDEERKRLKDKKRKEEISEKLYNWVECKQLIKIIKFVEKENVDLSTTGKSYLFQAARLGYLELVKYFVNQGVDPNSGNGLAGYFAYENNHHEVYDYLIENGCVSYELCEKPCWEM